MTCIYAYTRMEMKIFDTGDHILRAVNSSHAAYVLQKKLSRDYYN